MNVSFRNQAGDSLLVSFCNRVLQGQLPLADALAQLRDLEPLDLSGLGPLAGMTRLSSMLSAQMVRPDDLEEMERRYAGYTSSGQLPGARVAAEMGIAGSRVMQNRQYEAYFSYLPQERDGPKGGRFCPPVLLGRLLLFRRVSAASKSEAAALPDRVRCVPARRLTIPA